MPQFKTEQEKFWNGEFGDDYVSRNRLDIRSKTAMFVNVLRACGPINSVFEIGPNIGLNLDALKSLLPHAQMAGIEINAKAHAEVVKKHPAVAHGSALDYKTSEQFDFVLSAGVMIHINPDMLPPLYDKLISLSRKYVCVAEYYNPVPVTIPYRGHSDRLFKRDFAGEIMDRHNLKLVDYGFMYHRGQFPVDDVTWFLLEKVSG